MGVMWNWGKVGIVGLALLVASAPIYAHHHLSNERPYLVYSSDQPEKSDLTKDQGVKRVSFTNERKWPLLRDQIYVRSQERPMRYVVAVGLQQPMELLFAGVDRVMMVDLYKPGVSAFVYLAELAKKHENFNDWAAEAERGLSPAIDWDTDKDAKDGGGAHKGAKGSKTPNDFIEKLRKFGETGYKNFRRAVLLGNVKAVHASLSDPGLGKKLLAELSGLHPSVLYLSNVPEYLISTNKHDQYYRFLSELAFEFKKGEGKHKGKTLIGYESTLVRTKYEIMGDFEYHIRPAQHEFLILEGKEKMYFPPKTVLDKEGYNNRGRNIPLSQQYGVDREHKVSDVVGREFILRSPQTGELLAKGFVKSIWKVHNSSSFKIVYDAKSSIGSVVEYEPSLHTIEVVETSDFSG